MHVHPIVSFLVEVILNLLQLKFNGTHPNPMMILLSVFWLLLYSWVALIATSAAATAASSSSPTSDSPSNRAVAGSDLSLATIVPPASSPEPAAISPRIVVAQTPRSSASGAASCPSSPAPATDSASRSLPAATSNPSLSDHTVIDIDNRPPSFPPEAVPGTSSSRMSMELGKTSNSASKLIAKIKCRPEKLMSLFGWMAISTFGCLLFPTSAQHHVLYTSYALVIGFHAIFLCLLPR